MRKTVVAIFESRREAEYASDLLLGSGFDNRNINVIDGKTSNDETNNESWTWCFLKNLFKSIDTKANRWLNAAQRAFMISVTTNSEKDALVVAEILDDCGAMDVEQDYNKYFWGNEYRDDSDYEREARFFESGSSLIMEQAHHDRNKNFGSYYREDADFEIDDRRFKNYQSGKLESLTGDEGMNGYQTEVGIRPSMRSLIIDKPIAAWKFVEEQFQKRLKLA